MTQDSNRKKVLASSLRACLVKGEIVFQFVMIPKNKEQRQRMLNLGLIQDVKIYFEGNLLEEFEILIDGFFKELGECVVFQVSTPWVQGQDSEAQAIILALVEKGVVPFLPDPTMFLGANGELGINFPLPLSLPE